MTLHQLVTLLEREQHDEGEHAGDKWVEGWNARARSLLALLKPRVMSGVVEFDLSDTEVE